MGVVGNLSRWMRRSSSCPDKSRKLHSCRQIRGMHRRQYQRRPTRKEISQCSFFYYCGVPGNDWIALRIYNYSLRPTDDSVVVSK